MLLSLDVLRFSPRPPEGRRPSGTPNFTFMARCTFPQLLRIFSLCLNIVFREETWWFCFSGGLFFCSPDDGNQV